MCGYLKIKAIPVIAVLFCVYLCSSGVTGQKNGEGKKICEQPKLFAYELDYDWVMGHRGWYFPMLNKQDLLRQSSDILEQPLEQVVEEKELSSKACLKATWDGLSPIIKGFSGKRTTYTLSPSDWTNFNILTYEKSWEQGQAGTLYITHTDNKHFVFFVRCWDDGERTWSVMTTTKKPSEKIKKEILEHVKTLGFPENDVVHLDYEKCKKAKKTEL
jgi:hypothetical protein